MPIFFDIEKYSHKKGNAIILCWSMVSFRGQINLEPRLFSFPSGVLIPVSGEHLRNFYMALTSRTFGLSVVEIAENLIC